MMGDWLHVVRGWGWFSDNENRLGHAENEISVTTKVSLVREKTEAEICSEGIKDIN